MVEKECSEQDAVGIRDQGAVFFCNRGQQKGGILDGLSVGNYKTHASGQVFIQECIDPARHYAGNLLHRFYAHNVEGRCFLVKELIVQIFEFGEYWCRAATATTSTTHSCFSFVMFFYLFPLYHSLIVVEGRYNWIRHSFFLDISPCLCFTKEQDKERE